MNLDIEKLNSFLKISQIVLNLFLINLYLILLSVLSLGILTPTLIGATYSEIDYILEYNLNGVNKRFFANVIKNFKYTFGKILCMSTAVNIIIVTMLFFNLMVFGEYSLAKLCIVLGTQIVMIFELINIIQVALIQIFVLNNTNINQVLKNSFVIVNTNIGKFFVANISLIITLTLVKYLSIFMVIFISLSLALYYISTHIIIKKFYEKYHLNI